MENKSTISPELNALDSLKRMAHELEQGLNDKANPLRLKGVIAWSWHVVGLLAYLRLRPGRQIFDAWVQNYLHEGSPELSIERDAHWEERERLSFLELLDIISDTDLPSLKPEFYQGWQDRNSRCRWLREQARQLIGFSLSENDRNTLMLLLAVYHRLIRLPAGVELDIKLIAEAVPALFNLMEKLIDKDLSMAEDLNRVLGRCRSAL